MVYELEAIHNENGKRVIKYLNSKKQLRIWLELNLNHYKVGKITRLETPGATKV